MQFKEKMNEPHIAAHHHTSPHIKGIKCRLIDKTLTAFPINHTRQELVCMTSNRRDLMKVSECRFDTDLESALQHRLMGLVLLSGSVGGGKRRTI